MRPRRGPAAGKGPSLARAVGCRSPPDTPVPPDWAWVLEQGWNWWPWTGWIGAGHCSDVHTRFGGVVPLDGSPQLCPPALWGSCVPRAPQGFARLVWGSCTPRCQRAVHSQVGGAVPPDVPRPRLCTPAPPVLCHAPVPLLPDGFSVPRRGRFPGNLHTLRPQHLRAWERAGGAPPSPGPAPDTRGPWGSAASPGQPTGAVRGAGRPAPPNRDGGCPTKPRGQLPAWGPLRGDTQGHAQTHCKPH